MSLYELQIVNTKACREQFVTFRKNDFESWPASKHEWFYECNIYGKATCLILNHKETGEVVGSIAVFPRKLFIKGNVAKAGITGDFGVNPKHRSLGPALKLQKKAIQCCRNGDFALLYGYANKKSGPVQKRAGFIQVGTPVRYVKYLCSYSYLSRYLNIPIITKIIAFFVDILMTIYSINFSIKSNMLHRFTVDPKVDDRFDRLWQTAEKPAFVVGERNKQFLTWRFLQCVHKRYRFFSMQKKDSDAIDGYIVFYENGKNLRIADMYALNKSAFSDLTAGFLRFAKKNQYHNVDLVYLGSSAFKDILVMHKFFPRTSDTDFFVYLKETDNYNNIPIYENNWYYFEADSDT